jgi:hypothetical protein
MRGLNAPAPLRKPLTCGVGLAGRFSFAADLPEHTSFAERKCQIIPAFSIQIFFMHLAPLPV